MPGHFGSADAVAVELLVVMHRDRYPRELPGEFERRIVMRHRAAAVASDIKAGPRDQIVEAKLGLPEVGLGLIPGLGGTQRLTRLCGAGVASRLILGAEVLDGVAARDLGLVQWAVPRTSIADDAAQLVKRVAALPTPALKAAKEHIAAAAAAHTTGFALERELGGRLLETREAKSLIVGFLRRSGKVVADEAEDPLM